MILGSDFFIFPSIAAVINKALGFHATSVSASGAFTITDANLGATPKAGLLIGGKDGGLGMGLYDGTGIYSLYGRNRDNVNPANSRMTSSTTKIYSSVGQTTNVVESNISAASFASNTMNLSFDSVPEVATNLLGILLNATNAVLTHHEIINTNLTATKTGLAFTPNFFITISMPHNVVGGVITSVNMNLGFATSAVNQGSLSYGSINNVTPTQTLMYISDSVLSYNILTNTTLSLTAVTSDGYTITKSATGGSSTIAVLACEIPNNVIISIKDTPTTTGLQVLNLGANTKDHIILLSTLIAANTLTNSTEANAMSIGIVNSNISASYGIISEDNIATSDTGAYYDSDSVVLQSDVGVVIADFVFDSYTANGPQLNWTVAPGVAKKMLVLGID